MPREVYVLRNGELVPKHEAAPRGESQSAHIISDTMPAMIHPSNGKMYDSKSRFRNETKARGLTEVGNEPVPDRKPTEFSSLRNDLNRAWERHT